MTTKDKIDAVLGISSGKSIDDFLDDLDKETQDLKKSYDEIDEKLKDNLAIVDANLSAIQPSTGVSSMNLLSLSTMDKSMSEIEQLIFEAKKVFAHVTESIMSTDLVDSELISACARFLQELRNNISQFISLYKDRQNFLDKVKLMMIQQQQRLEQMQFKHDLDMKKIAASSNNASAGNVIDAGEIIQYSQEEIIKQMAKEDDMQIEQSMQDITDTIINTNSQLSDAFGLSVNVKA